MKPSADTMKTPIAPVSDSATFCAEFNRWFLGKRGGDAELHANRGQDGPRHATADHAENYKVVLAESGKPVDFKAANVRRLGTSYSSALSNYIGEFPRAVMSFGFPKMDEKSSNPEESRYSVLGT